MKGGEAGSEQLSMMCWNVCGWLRKNGGQHELLNDEYDMRSAVIGFYSPDVVAVVESWLKGEDEAVVEGISGLGIIESICTKMQLEGQEVWGFCLKMRC